jgi:SARP family transcriptional regulator, regulator of embCAB operon
LVEQFSGSHRYVFDYLTEEVLARQPEELVGFLLETSILDRLSGSLCDAVTGRTDSQALLEGIERGNLFLYPMDEVRGWWRYHHLSADLLPARAEQRQASRSGDRGGGPRRRSDPLTVLLSKTRTAVRPADAHGRGELRLALPPDAWIDVEAALEAVHRAESAVTQGGWPEAWGAALVARFVATRRFLAGHDATWVEAWRRRLADVLVRSLEAYAAASLGVGGTELAAAERASIELIERAPFRESGYRLLMEVKAARGNVAEALHVYEQLRVLLREELGVAPSPAVQAVHKRLLLEGAPD